MAYTLRHAFDIDPETFWEKIFFDEAFNKKLFIEHLGHSEWEVLDFERRDDGVITRRVRTSPPAEVPGPAKKFLGDKITFVEDGRMDPKTKHWHFDVIPGMSADRIKTKGELWVEPKGDGGCERVCQIDTEVKIFGVGKMIASLIEQQSRNSYDKAAEFTRRWIREQGG